MSRGLADTSLFIAREVGRPVDEAKVPTFMAVSVVTYAELRAGVLDATEASVRHRRLATLESIGRDGLVSIDSTVAESWAALRVGLRDAGSSMKINDSWIAATAMALGVPVVTQDGDFDGVPGLEVIRV